MKSRDELTMEGLGRIVKAISESIELSSRGEKLAQERGAVGYEFQAFPLNDAGIVLGERHYSPFDDPPEYHESFA